MHCMHSLPHHNSVWSLWCIASILLVVYASSLYLCGVGALLALPTLHSIEGCYWLEYYVSMLCVVYVSSAMLLGVSLPSTTSTAMWCIISTLLLIRYTSTRYRYSDVLHVATGNAIHIA